MQSRGPKSRNNGAVLIAFLAAFLLSLYVVHAALTKPTQAAGKPVVWQTDMYVARNLSQSTGKPILVDFCATWCDPCQAMLQDTFPSPQVQPLLNNVICVRVDVDENQALAQQYNVTLIPRILLLGANGTIKMDVTGYEDPDSFAADLRNGLGTSGS